MRYIMLTALLAMALIAASAWADTKENCCAGYASLAQFGALVWRVQELERKMEGVQHQITVLHSKKADKKAERRSGT